MREREWDRDKGREGGERGICGERGVEREGEGVRWI